MKGIIRDNLVLCNQLMLDTDYKLRIAMRLNPEDEELKEMVEVRKDMFAESYKEDDFEMKKDDEGGKKNEKDGDDAGDEIDGDDENHKNGGNGRKDGDDGNYQNDQMGEQNNEDRGNDNITGGECRKEEGKKDEANEKHDLVDLNDILKKLSNEKENYELLGKGLVGTKDNAIVPFDLDLLSSQNGTQSADEYETETQEMQYDDLEDIVPLPVSQEPENIISSSNKRRKLNPEDDVTLSQLTWAMAGEPSVVETEMVDNIIKLPFLSTGVTGATKGLAVDALKSKAEVATPPYHSLKLKLKRNSSGNYDAKKVDKSDVAKESTVNVLDAVPVSSVAPEIYIPMEKKQKEKSIAATKSKGKKSDNSEAATKSKAEGKKAATNKEPAKKKATNVAQAKKAVGKQGEAKQEMGKAKKAPTKKPEPKTVKEDTQKLKRGQKRGANAIEDTKEADIVKEKRTIKPSNAMVSPFYNRKVMIFEKWPEADMKLVEYIWSDSCPEG